MVVVAQAANELAPWLATRPRLQIKKEKRKKERKEKGPGKRKISKSRHNRDHMWLRWNLIKLAI